jgi:hypothetical protein
MEQLEFDFSGKRHSIKEQTGWKRLHPKMLLQDVNLLLKVTSFDYDLTDPEFVEYAHQRGSMSGAGYPERIDPDYESQKRFYAKNPCFEADYRYLADPNYVGNQLRPWLRNHHGTQEEFLRSEDMKYTKSGALLSEEHRLITWKCICIARAHLQDCWEIFQLCEARTARSSAA